MMMSVIHIALNDRMILNNELDRTWRKPTKVLPRICQVTEANYKYEYTKPKSECLVSELRLEVATSPGTMQKHL
jgi:hypothetical protein